MSFTTLLVANRGEIARRVIRSAHDMGIRCVAVYVDADADSPFVREADEAVRLESSYLDSAAILDAARATGAGAIHPGYGFLSENAGFASDVIEAGIAWVGPSPDAIRQMGDKIAAKLLAEKAQLPTLPGSQDTRTADGVGYPLLVKAAAGGGGKGMRLARSADALEESVAAARREAKSSFGDDRVFLERYVAHAHHIEIQILGDSHGNIVHLGERECSIQRRHQKILEESPAPCVDAELREAMGEAALRLAREIGYQSAGTVEFLLDEDSGEFFFLEVNTRLQVEHPVTEMVTGIDLVREQLRIAAGEPLGREQSDITFTGSAIEARLYAEDPTNEFLPATGTLAAFAPSPTPEVRWDSGVVAGSVIGTDFDPLLAKVIAHAPTRREAAGRLALALVRTHLAGVVTNRDFLVNTLRTPEFLAGNTTTDFIDRVKPARSRQPSEEERTLMARLAALWVQGSNRASAMVLGMAPSGWRNGRLFDQKLVLDQGETSITLLYRSLRDGRFRFADGADGATARIHAWRQDEIDVEIGGRRIRSRVTRAGDQLIVHGPNGDLVFTERPRFRLPGGDETADGFVAQMPGKVIELRVKVGDRVTAGDTLLVLEAMKMEHPMRATEDGVVIDVRVAEGEQVESGTLLLVVEPAEQDNAKKDGE
ncbi:MAG: carbamoyl-phosphate synthase L chain ATP-binding protein [Deltaproteobacteria bacterium]|nr:MAG: carbamoyl-phosphate synthase L chain ATP-binding protein [Deltaproteobacteria bacterium]